MDFDDTNLATKLKDKNLFRQKCFINGEWMDSESGKTFEIYNPSDSTLIGLINILFLLLPLNVIIFFNFLNSRIAG